MAMKLRVKSNEKATLRWPREVRLTGFEPVTFGFVVVGNYVRNILLVLPLQ